MAVTAMHGALSDAQHSAELRKAVSDFADRDAALQSALAATAKPIKPPAKKES